MKKILILVLTLFCFSLNSRAQRPQGQGATSTKQVGNASIQGVIVDSVTNNPVEFAAVALWQAGKAIDGSLTAINGKFKFEGLNKGTYKILISYIGYKAQSIENIVLSENSTKRDLKNLRLIGDNIQLDEVTVTSQSMIIEDKIDRLVYHADKDISNRGATADEVLRKVPMLSVDLDGEVELRGSANVRVLINNKPSTIFASSVGEALKQIPADQIKSVEVITSPSAKYDGDGSAGIVNIILKKNTLAGVTGNVRVGTGLNSTHTNGTLNLRDKKWGISLNGGGRFSYGFKTEGENKRVSVIDGKASYLTQTDNNIGKWNNGRYRATFDYDFDKKTNFSIGYSGRIRTNGGKGDQLTVQLNENEELIYSTQRYIDQTRKSNSSDLDFTFEKRYDNPIKELSIMAQYSKNKASQFYIADENEMKADSSLNDGNDQEISFRLDYVQPLGEKVKWEMGGKAILRSVKSEGSFYTYDLFEEEYIYNTNRSNYLDYDQNVAAAYSSFTVSLPKKWGIQAGLRYERTMIDADFKEQAGAEIPDYDNLLPSINLSKRFEKGGSVRASYTQRIQRPSIRYLNPYVNYSNEHDISYGNPELDPELVDMFEVAVNSFFGSNSINVSVYTRLENNSITSVKSVDRVDGIDYTETTYENIGVNKRYGMNVSVNLNPTKKWRLGGGLNGSYTYMDNGTISNSGWNGGLRLNTSYSFNKGWAASAFAFFRSPRVQLQGTRNGFYFHGLTMKKDINKKRGSIGITLENPFVESINFKSDYEDLTDPNAYFRQSSNRSIYRRSFRIDFQYRFGKMESNRNGLFRRRGNNDNDSVDDDGGDGGGGNFRRRR